MTPNEARLLKVRLKYPEWRRAYANYRMWWQEVRDLGRNPHPLRSEVAWARDPHVLVNLWSNWKDGDEV